MRTRARICFVVGMLIILGALIGTFAPMSVRGGSVDCGNAVSGRSKSDIESDVSSNSIFDAGDCATKLQLRREFVAIGGGIGVLFVLYAWKTDNAVTVEERRRASR